MLHNRLKTIQSKRYHDRNGWKDLVNILQIVGAKMAENTLYLDWDSPDTDQFGFLLKLMSQVTNEQLTGSYCSFERHWAVSV